MRDCGVVWAVLVTAGWLWVTPALEAQTERPAVRRARELIAIIDRADVASMRAYADTAYDESMREPDELSADLGLDGGVTRFLLNQRERSRRLTWVSIDTAGPASRADVDVRSQRTGRVTRLVVVVEREAPFRIVGLGDDHPPRATVPPVGERIRDDATLARRTSLLVTPECYLCSRPLTAIGDAPSTE